MSDDKTMAPAAPLRAIQAPEPVVEEVDARSLSERAREAYTSAQDVLDARMEERSGQEAVFALQRLMAAYGGTPENYALTESGPESDDRWGTAWDIFDSNGEPEDFGLFVVRVGTKRDSPTFVIMYDDCEMHERYAVSGNLGTSLADLGRELDRRHEWRCPLCELERMTEEKGLSPEATPSEMIGASIVAVVGQTVRGMLEAEKALAMEQR
jgi:hypothetical protein